MGQHPNLLTELGQGVVLVRRFHAKPTFAHGQGAELRFIPRSCRRQPQTFGAHVQSGRGRVCTQCRARPVLCNTLLPATRVQASPLRTTLRWSARCEAQTTRRKGIGRTQATRCSSHRGCPRLGGGSSRKAARGCRACPGRLQSGRGTDSLRVGQNLVSPEWSCMVLLTASPEARGHMAGSCKLLPLP